MKTLIAILVLFSTSTFFNHAKSLEYTVLSDEEVKYFFQTYTNVNDLWYGMYAYDNEGKEEKIGYTHNRNISDNYIYKIN